MTPYELVNLITHLKIPEDENGVSARAMLSIVIDAARWSASDIGPGLRLKSRPHPIGESPDHSERRYRIKWRWRDGSKMDDVISSQFGVYLSLDLAQKCCNEANRKNTDKLHWYEEILPWSGK